MLRMADQLIENGERTHCQHTCQPAHLSSRHLSPRHTLCSLSAAGPSFAAPTLMVAGEIEEAEAVNAIAAWYVQHRLSSALMALITSDCI